MGESGRAAVQKQAERWWWVVAAILLVYVCGPDFVARIAAKEKKLTPVVISRSAEIKAPAAQVAASTMITPSSPSHQLLFTDSDLESIKKLFRDFPTPCRVKVTSTAENAELRSQLLQLVDTARQGLEPCEILENPDRDDARLFPDLVNFMGIRILGDPATYRTMDDLVPRMREMGLIANAIGQVGSSRIQFEIGRGFPWMSMDAHRATLAAMVKDDDVEIASLTSQIAGLKAIQEKMQDIQTKNYPAQVNDALNTMHQALKDAEKGAVEFDHWSTENAKANPNFYMLPGRAQENENETNRRTQDGAEIRFQQAADSIKQSVGLLNNACHF